MTRLNMKNFVEHQEILNNIKTSIVKLYANDGALEDDNFLAELTVKTLEVINHMDDIFDGLLEDPGIISVAEQFDCAPEKIAQDVVEIMMFSTIARQNMLIEELRNSDDE